MKDLIARQIVTNKMSEQETLGARPNVLNGILSAVKKSVTALNLIENHTNRLQEESILLTQQQLDLSKEHLALSKKMLSKMNLELIVETADYKVDAESLEQEKKSNENTHFLKDLLEFESDHYGLQNVLFERLFNELGEKHIKTSFDLKSVLMDISSGIESLALEKIPTDSVDSDFFDILENVPNNLLVEQEKKSINTEIVEGNIQDIIDADPQQQRNIKVANSLAQTMGEEAAAAGIEKAQTLQAERQLQNTISEIDVEKLLARQEKAIEDLASIVRDPADRENIKSKLSEKITDIPLVQRDNMSAEDFKRALVGILSREKLNLEKNTSATNPTLEQERIEQASEDKLLLEENNTLLEKIEKNTSASLEQTVKQEKLKQKNGEKPEEKLKEKPGFIEEYFPITKKIVSSLVSMPTALAAGGMALSYAGAKMAAGPLGEARADTLAQEQKSTGMTLSAANDPFAEASLIMHGEKMSDTEKLKMENERQALKDAPWYTRLYGIGKTEYLAKMSGVGGMANNLTSATQEAVEAREKTNKAPTTPVIVNAPTNTTMNKQNIAMPSSIRNPDPTYTGFMTRNMVF